MTRLPAPSLLLAQVRDTTAWTVGRICDLYFVHIDLDKYFVLIIEVAKKALKDEARVAANACFVRACACLAALSTRSAPPLTHARVCVCNTFRSFTTLHKP